jgi:penicillin-binding protein 1A
MPIAGKTGTTQRHSDGWFIGMTPRLCAGSWTGADLRSIHFSDLQSGQGASTALPIWGYFMKKVLADPSLGYNQKDEFIRPANFRGIIDCGEEIPGEERKVLEFDEFF